MKKRWKVLALTLAVAAAISFGLPAIFHGWSFSVAENTKWIKILFSSSRQLIFWPDNATITGVVAKHFGSEAAGVWTNAVAALLFLWAQWTVRPSAVASLALQSCVILPLTPLGWPYWALFSFPALFVVDRTLSKDHGWQKWVLYGVLLITLNIVNGGNALRGLPIIGCVIMAVLVVREFGSIPLRRVPKTLR